MCWSSTKIPIRKIADKDIPCIKIILQCKNGNYQAAFNNYDYSIGKLYEQESNLQIVNFPNNYKPVSFLIRDGFHSYSMECRFTYDNYVLVIYPKNNPFYDDYLNFFCDYDYFIGLFIIPKDSEYYENEKGEIVSSKIKFQKVIDIKDIEMTDELSLLKTKLFN